MTVWSRLTLDLVQVRLRLRHARLRRLELRFRRSDVDLRGFQLRPGDQAAVRQLLALSSLTFGIVERDTRSDRPRPDARDVRLLLLDLRLRERRIEPRDDLALLDDRVEVGVELLDRPGHLRADLYGRHRLERPVAPTVSTMSPRVTWEVMICGGLSPRRM